MYRRPSLTYPEVPLYQGLEEAAERWPERTALVHGGNALTYAQLNAQADRFAAALAGLGAQKDDKVCLLLPNAPEFVVAFYGTLKAGGVVSALNPSYKEREVSYQYKESDAVALVTREDFYPVVQAASTSVPINAIVSSTEPVEGAHHFQALLDQSPPQPPKPPVNPKEDLASLPFTSGTTGYPKGVMLTHGNLDANWRQFVQAGGLGDEDALLLFLPLYHIYGTMLMGGGLMAGAQLVLQERFHPQETVALIQAHKPTVLYVVPPVLVFYNQLPDIEGFDWSSLKYVMSGAAPLSKEVALRFQERTGVTVLQGYGMTESSPVTHCNPPERAHIRVETVGPPVADTEQKVVDLDTGADLPPGEVGELLLRGPQVMKGYWKRPEENAAVLADGWLHTGDMAMLDADGYCTIVDRAKNMIKYKGFAIGPAELEDVLFEHPAVADCAVIGVPDQEAGEVPKAFVVKKADVAAQELLDFVAERVANYKQIRRLDFIDQIPKNPSGKILKRVLVEQERAQG